jgi:hypothetical protein
MYLKYQISAAFCFLVITNAHAVENNAALKLVEISMGETWPAMKQMIDGNFDNQAKIAKEKQPRDLAGEIFIEELKNAFNLESLTKLFAAEYARRLTPAELDEALAYLSSPLSKKQRDIANSFKDPRLVAPIVQDACNRARSRLSSVGAVSSATVDQACPLK